MRLARFAKHQQKLTEEYYTDPDYMEEKLNQRLEQMGFKVVNGRLFGAIDEEGNTVSTKTLNEDVRIRMGQFGEILMNTAILKEMMAQDPDAFCDRRDEALSHLYQAREYIYPELKGRGHSFGIAKFEDADRVFDIHQVIRHAMGDPRDPFSLVTVGGRHQGQSKGEGNT